MIFRPAAAADAHSVCALVNAAYRGESSRRGWTTEADVLDGQRIDPDMFLVLIGEEGARVELAFLPEGGLAGCVELKRESPGCCYLGMLTIDPARQRGGLGHRLLARAEQLAREWGCSQMRMRVIEGRDALIQYYQRRGYRLTGEHEPFPQGDPRFGIPKVRGLRFCVLAKPLL
ncbi:MAG: GNAT family N-acetyltransferase [Elusimicrobia bacterium]|nr:GNAT family N-acetyltransferase [Elusimicrobiota bacterium]